MDGSADAAAGGGAQASALHADILELVARCWPSDAEAQALLDELRARAAAVGGDGRPGDDAADEDELSSGGCDVCHSAYRKAKHTLSSSA